MKLLTEHLYCKNKSDLHSSKNCRVCDTAALSLQAEILCGLCTRMYSVQLYLGEHEGREYNAFLLHIWKDAWPCFID